MAASVVLEAQMLEGCLAARRVRARASVGPLSPWGHAREREVRMLGSVRLLRPRRARGFSSNGAGSPAEGRRPCVWRGAGLDPRRVCVLLS